VVGTLAGDDTILAVTPDSRRARAFIKRLEALTHGNADDAPRAAAGTRARPS
jgi:hypothetical protein